MSRSLCPGCAMEGLAFVPGYNLIKMAKRLCKFHMFLPFKAIANQIAVLAPGQARDLRLGGENRVAAENISESRFVFLRDARKFLPSGSRMQNHIPMPKRVPNFLRFSAISHRRWRLWGAHSRIFPKPFPDSCARQRICFCIFCGASACARMLRPAALSGGGGFRSIMAGFAAGAAEIRRAAFNIPQEA